MTDRARSDRRGAGRQVPWFPLAIAVMVALGGVAIFLSRDTGPAADAVATAAVRVDGDPLPEFTGPQGDAAISEPAPALVGTGLEGEPTVIRPGDDGPMAIVFLAHWCPHCQAEVQALTPWIEDGGVPDGVQLHAISTLVSEQRPNFPPSGWLEEAGWPVATLADDADSSAAEAYGLTGTPFWVFVDGDGRVAARASGQLGVGQLEQILSELART